MVREKQNNWQRIEAVVIWANMTTNYFARYIGLARGENLYQIKRGNNGISLDVADRIVSRFPEIDKLWLLTGEGQMFADEKLCGAEIPYYDIDLAYGIRQADCLEPISSMVIPQLSGCDMAIRYDGRDMGTSVPPGTVVLLEAVERDAIIPGAEYVIVSQKIVTLRIVRATETEGQLRLVAVDRDNYDDIVLDVSDIMSVYKVKGKLIINT